MAAGSVSRVIRSPGRVVVGPTNLGLAFPHGGTEVGKTRQFLVQSLGGGGLRVAAEGVGETTEILEPSERFVATFFLRGWDDDAVRLFFSDYHVLGGASGHAVLSVPGLAVPGASALSRGRVVLFEPDDPVNIPSVLLYNAIPDWNDNAEMAFQRGEELGIPLALECVRNASGNVLKIGRLADLTL